MMISRTLVLNIANWSPMKRFMTTSKVSKGLVNRFIAGDNIEEALVAVKTLNEQGFTVSLDFLGENSTSKDEALLATETYNSILEAISKQDISADISIKLTQIGLDFEDEFIHDNLIQVLKIAKEYGNDVNVDMEGSEYTQKTVDIVSSVFKEYDNLGTVIQAYLKRSEADIDHLIKLGMRVRIVKGAYLEPQDIAFQNMNRINSEFDRIVEKLLLEGNYPAIASHDPHRINHALDFAKKNNIPKENFEFQMLYGIRRDLQEKIKKDGYNVRVYLPYGVAWYPYFSRRLAERPANMFFIIKNLFRK